ncbi:inositol-1-monophosphatase 3 [Bordetella holmesii]|nr:inositol-1-monophosphatase 3 [Bordetella holmesii]
MTPTAKNSFAGVYGIGSWLNGRRIACSRTPRLEDSVLATGFPFRDFSFAPEYMPMLSDAISRSRGVRRMGAAALDLAWVACGRYDGYWEMGLAPWDVAAGTLLVREAGGICHDMSREASWPITGRLVSGNPAVYDALHDMVTPHLKRPA